MIRSFQYASSSGCVQNFVVQDSINFELLRARDIEFISDMLDNCLLSDAARIAAEELLSSLQHPSARSKPSVTSASHFYAVVLEAQEISPALQPSARKHRSKNTFFKAHLRSLLPSSNIRLFKISSIIN